MAVKNLTLIQVDIIITVRNHKQIYGYAPSIRELAAHLGVCRGTIVGHLKRLEQKGAIQHAPRIARSLEITIPNS